MSRSIDAPLEVEQVEDESQQQFEEIDKLVELAIAAADIKKYVSLHRLHRVVLYHKPCNGLV